MTKRSLLFIGLLCAACADVRPIQDGRSFGPVVTLADWFTSCQLLKTGEGAVLFDACFREGALENRLAAHALEPGDVSHVLLTHAHRDHVGGLELLEHAEVLALEGARANLARHADGRRIDRVLADGEVLTFGDHEVRVFSTPGHTPGSAAYLVGGALVLGDNAVLTGDGTLAPPPERNSDDPARVIATLAALDERLDREGLEVRWLVPAHSGGVEGRQALTDLMERRR
jgi:glyoxylase-like metal-dependent hydrolase (beta-lactamase superfamily II)